MSQLVKRVLKNFMVGILGRIIAQGVSIVSVAYVARVLGPQVYGDISLIVAIVSYFSLVTGLGLPTVGLREVAKDQQSSSGVVGNILVIRSCLALVAFCLLLLYGYFLLADKKWFTLLVLYGLGLFSNAILLDWAFIGLEKIQYTAFANAASSIFSFILTIFLIKSSQDVYLLPIIGFVSSLGVCLYLFYYYIMLHPTKLGINIKQICYLLKLSLPFVITSVLSQVYGNVDMILLGFIKGAEQVGYYSVSYKIVYFMSGIIGIYSQATFPVMSRLNSISQEKVANFLKYNICAILLLLSPMIIGGILIADNVIILVFGELYKKSAGPFILLLFYVLLMALNVTIANFILVVSADITYMKTLSMGAISNVLCNIILIPLYGAVGSAMSMVLSEVIISLYLVIVVKKYVKKIFDIKFIVITMADCLLMSSVIYIINRILGWSIILALFIGTLFYIGVVLLNYKKEYVRSFVCDDC